VQCLRLRVRLLLSVPCLSPPLDARDNEMLCLTGEVRMPLLEHVRPTLPLQNTIAVPGMANLQYVCIYVLFVCLFCAIALSLGS
jgi:hypothetical protein